MKLVDDSSNFLKFWSVRFGGLAAMFSLLEMLGELQPHLPILQHLIPEGPFALLSFGCAVASVISRVIRQAKLHEAQ